MPTITESDFNLQIKSQNFKRAYFIYGEEKYLVGHYTKLLTDKILLNNNNSFNLQNFSSPDLNIAALNDAVEALPLFASFKCVRLFDFDVEKEPADTVKKLKEIISDVPETTVLIVSLSNLKVDLKRSSKWASFVKFFEKYGEVLNLPAMNNVKLQKQLIKWAEKLSCGLSEKNAQIVIDKCGNDLLTLKNELEKLCAYANKSEITAEMINGLVVENFEANVFELTKAIMAQNYERAFKVLDVLYFNKEEPIAILSVMSSVYIDIYRVKVATQNGKSIYDIAEIFDYKRKMFRLENAQRYSRNISMESVRKCLELMTETDMQLKSSKMDSKVLLEKLIAKLAAC